MPTSQGKPRARVSSTRKAKVRIQGAHAVPLSLPQVTSLCKAPSHMDQQPYMTDEEEAAHAATTLTGKGLGVESRGSREQVKS